MHGLLEQRWLAPDCLPEAAPQAEACGPGQILGAETTLVKVRFRAAIYFIVTSGHVKPLLHKAGVGVL